MTTREQLQRNLTQVRQRIAAACARVARDPADVRLIAVTKYAPLPVVRELLQLHLVEFGENRPQQLAQRAAELGCELGDGAAASPQPRWRMIGHLQRNKVRQTLAVCREIHSLDSVRLADEIESRARLLEVPPGGVAVYVEVNIAAEDSKSGVDPATARDVVAHVARCPSLRLMGLMTMAPYVEPAEQTRPVFAALRHLRDELIAANAMPATAAGLSMGMSNDFEIAIEEGATAIRVGSVLFEGVETEDPR